MRAYIARHLLAIGALSAVVVLCLIWLVYKGVADNDVLTVEQCIDATDDAAANEKALIEEDLIDEGLLQTRVTNGMCKDMLESLPDGTLQQKLSASQNYIQEIKLIESAMSEAADEETADEETARGSDRYSLRDDSSLVGAIASTSEQIAAQSQYDDGIGGIEPRELQAAAAARVGEDNDASIAKMLHQKEAAAENAGASVPEASAGARCSTELAVLDEELKKAEKGLYEIIPRIPKEIRLGASEHAGLQVKVATIRDFRGISQKHEAIDENSKSNMGCIVLTNRMRAQLLPTRDLDALSVDRVDYDDIKELSSHLETRWSWDINGRRAGNSELSLYVSYEISQKSPKFRQMPKSPAYEGPLKVTSEDPKPWWQRLFGFFGD
jgi:hypothetical protein